MPTTLTRGQVAIIGVNTEDLGSPNRDFISFILLAPITTGTVIFFTDRSWNGTTFSATGGADAADGTFTYTAAGNLAAGTVITINQAQLTAAGMALDHDGDAIYVYQGTNANTPTTFLHAVELADGNNTFNGNLTNTGLVAGTSALAIADDNAEFGGRTHNIGMTDLFVRLNTTSRWVHNDNSPQDGTVGINAVTGTGTPDPAFTAPDAQIWVAASGGGEGIVTINLDGTYASGTLGYQIVQAFQNDANLFHPSDISLDTVHGKFFFADSDATGHNRIVEGNISQLLNNPGDPATFTILYSNAGSGPTGIIASLSVDTANGLIYFDIGNSSTGSSINKITYSLSGVSTSGQTPTQLASLGNGHYVTQMAIDYVHGTVIVGTTRVVATFGVDVVEQNYVYRATGLTSSSVSLTFTELPFNPDDNDAVAPNNPNIPGLPGEAWPVERGTIQAIDIDEVNQVLYIATGAVSLDVSAAQDGSQMQSHPGGIYSYALVGNPAGNVTTLFTQNFINGPVGLMDYIEVDPATGRYYVTDMVGTSADPSDQSVWTGSLTVAQTPTLVALIGNLNGLGPQGLEIQHAPVLTGASLAATFTETGGNPSPNGTPVTTAGTFNTTDVDSGAAANGDHLAGAQVRISGNFQSGAGHADQLLVSTFTTGTNQNGTIVIGGDTVTYSYNAAIGVMTFTGVTTLDNYENVIARIQFRTDGDNPTAFGTAGTRTISYSTFDGLLYSDEIHASVTVVGVNDAPVNTPGAAMNFSEDTTGNVGAEGIPPTPVRNAVTGISVFDVDADPATQDITVTLAVGVGTLTIRTNVAGGIQASDVISGNGTGTIVITATQNEINTTLAAMSPAFTGPPVVAAAPNGLIYTPPANYNGATNLTITTNDNGFSGNDPGLTGTGTSEQDQDVKVINIADVNDAPTVGGDGTESAATILEDTPFNQATPVVAPTVAALFGGQFADAVDIQVTGGNPTGSVGDTFAGIAIVADGSSVATGQWEYWNGSAWTDIGAASQAAARTFSAVTQIRFNPALNYNGAAPTLTVHLIETGGPAITNNGTVNLNPAGTATGGTTVYSTGTVVLSQAITAVNDAPVNTVGTTLTLPEDSGATNVTGMSIADVDANPATDVFTVTLDVLNGTLNLSTVVPGGVTAGNVTGNGTATINLTGTINQVNATLAAAGGLTYTPTAQYNGSDRVQITTNDGGATGQDPGLTGTATTEQDQDSKTISVTAVNDPVAGTAPASATVNEDATNVAIAGMSISDIDATLAPAGVYVVTLTSTNGTMTLTTLTGLTFSAGDGTADATMTFRGTLADLNNALATASYTPAANYNGSATITLGVTDTFGGIVATGTGAATNDSDVVNVTVTAVNDPVTTSAPASQTLNEDATNVAVTGMSISDIDATLAPAGVYDVTLTSTNGTLTLTTLTGLTFTVGDGTADSTMTFHGTLADINTALATANYTPTVNYAGSATITLSATDTFGGIVATGTGLATSDSDIINVTVTAVNDTPVVTVAASANSTEQVAGAIDATATIADVELGALDNYAGSALTVGRNGGAQPEDLLSFGPSGTFTVNGANLEVGGLVFATITGGTGSNLVITFTSSGTPATQALVNAVVQALQYTYTGDTPPASIVMDYSFTDGAPGNAGQGGGGSPIGTDSITINITNTAENAAPTLDLDADNSTAAGTSYAAAFTEGGAAVAIADTDVLITDADVGDNIESATIAIQSAVAGDLLTAGTLPAGISVDLINSTATTLILIGTATAADYEAAIEGVTFSNSSDDPGASRTIHVTVNDGSDNSAAAVSTIAITQINDAPTLTATGANPTFTEGSAGSDLFGTVDASAVEAGQTFTSLTLTVSNVTDGADEILFIDGSDVALTNGNSVTTATNGLGVTVTVAAGVATVTFSGAALTEALLETLVDGLAYRNLGENPTDADRVVTITQVVDSGAGGGADVNTTTLALASTVNVNPINDTPMTTVPGTQAINEDASVTLNTSNGNAIQVSDADATTLTVSLTVLHGTLTLASTTGLSFGAGDGTSDTTMTFSGTAAAINAALGAGLTYNPNGDFNGSDSIAVFTTDNGQTGGPEQTDTDSIAINITAINDAPVVSGDGTEDATDINEDIPGPGQTIQALFSGQYSDAADNQIPNGGASSPGQFSGIAVTANGSSAATGQWQYFSGGVWVDIGAVSDATAKLLGDPFVTLIRFNPALDFSGPAPTLTVHLIDNSLPFGIVNGQVVDISGPGATGGTTAYSSGTVVLSQFVIPDNFPPAVDLNTGTGGIDDTVSYTEDGASVAIGTAIGVTDADSGIGDNIESARVTLTDRVAGDSLVFSSPLPGGFSASTTATAGTFMIEISGTGTQAQYASILASIHFTTTSQDPTVGGTDTQRTIEVTVNDGDVDSATATTTVNITASDDPPVAQPDAFTITESGSIVAGNLFANNGSGTDTDPDGPPLAISAVNGSGGNVGTQIMLASGALLTVNSNGTFDYDPNGAFDETPTPGSGASNQPASDSFTYVLAGGSTVTVTITINGLDTADLLVGTSGDDTLDAGDGGDTLLGAQGTDYLFGGNGNDLLAGEAGIDGMTGGDGDDTYLVDDENDYVVENSGEGTDVVYSSVSFGLGTGVDVEILSTSDLAGTSAIDLYGNEIDNLIYGNAGANLLDGDGGVDVIVGYAGNDLLIGNEGNDVLDGGDDDDILLGGDDSDILSGGIGDDVIVGGAGVDGLYGGEGNDAFFVDNASDYVVENSGEGTDILFSSVSYSLGSGSEIEILSTDSLVGTAAINLAGNEFGQFVYGNAGANILSGGGGDDIVVGLAGTDTLLGGDGQDVLDGGADADTLIGGADHDTLLGGGGNDSLDGGTGADDMLGGIGDDSYYVDDALDLVLEAAGQGIDIVHASVSHALTGGSSVEILSTTSNSGTAAIDLTGNDLANIIYGNNGVNVLDGKDGNDVLIGLGGADSFRFSSALGANNVDQIAGFVAGTDKIQLDDAIFDTLGLGALPSTVFVVGTAATDEDHRIIYDSATGALYYDQDGAGGAAAVQFATLLGAPAITASDFTVI